MGPRGLCCLWANSWCPVRVPQQLSTCEILLHALLCGCCCHCHSENCRFADGAGGCPTGRHIQLSHVCLVLLLLLLRTHASAMPQSCNKSFEQWHDEHSHTGTYRPAMAPLLPSVVLQPARACAAGPAAPRCQAVHRASMAVPLRCTTRHSANRSHMHVGKASCEGPCCGALTWNARRSFSTMPLLAH